MKYFHKLPATILGIGFALMQVQIANAGRPLKNGDTIAYDNPSFLRINGESELSIQAGTLGIRRRTETLLLQKSQVDQNIYVFNTEFNSKTPINRFSSVAPQPDNIRASSILISSGSSNPLAQDFFLQAEEQAKRGYFEKALENFGQAIRLDPKYAEAYFRRGTLRSNFGQKQKAIEDFDQAIRLNPKYAEAYNNRGIARAGLKDLKGAIADYDQAIRLDPKLAPAAYLNRGIDRAELGDKQGAIADLQKAADLLKAQGNMRGYQHALNQIKRIGGR
jgi:tetratricopeptide (TPR) repeat protein